MNWLFWVVVVFLGYHVIDGLRRIRSIVGDYIGVSNLSDTSNYNIYSGPYINPRETVWKMQ